MSGGYFDYNQYVIGDIETQLEEFIKGFEKKGTYGDEYDPYCNIDDNFIRYCKDALYHLKMARIYTHRIDWVLSGDDGVETFYERLSEDIQEEARNFREIFLK